MLSDPERLLDQSVVEVGANSTSFESPLLERAVSMRKEAAPSFTEGVIALHPITKASKDMTSTFAEGDSGATDYKVQVPSKSVLEQPSDTRP